MGTWEYPNEDVKGGVFVVRLELGIGVGAQELSVRPLACSYDLS